MNRSLYNHLSRQAFSLIELLVVIGLIAALSVMTVIGIGKLQTNSRRQQTQLLFQNLQAMYADFDATSRLPIGMGHLNFQNLPATGVDGSQASVLNLVFTPCPQNVNLDYNSNFEHSMMPVYPQAYADRKGLQNNQAVPITRAFLAQLLAYPNNAAAVGKISSSALMTFSGFDPTNTVSWPTAKTTTNFAIGNHVDDGAGNIFIRTQIKVDASGYRQYDDPVLDGPPNPFYWIPALRVPNPIVLPSPPGTPGTALKTPLFLDGWGNPIIVVMGGALGSMQPLNADGTVKDKSGSLVVGGITFRLQSPDHRLFWASAGPDGDFSKGDDNMYSFEK